MPRTIPCLLLLAGLALAQKGGRGEKSFVAVSAGDESPVGQLRQIHDDGSVHLTTAEGDRTVRDFISLRDPATPLPEFPRGPVLITTTGDHVAGRVVGGDGEALRFQPASTKTEWQVPVAAVRVVWFTPMPADTPLDPARYPWLGEKVRRDVFRYRNGDRVPGTFTGFAPGEPELRFKAESGESRTVASSQLAAVAFNPALAAARRPKGRYYHLILRDGSRLDVIEPSVKGEKLTAKSLFNQQVEFVIDDVVGIDVIGGKATPLGVLKPAKVEQTGFLGPAWPWRRGRSVRGRPLRLLTDRGVETFDHGIGTHPRTVLTYDLGGKYRRFEAVVGLDPKSGRRGSAVVRVLVDGKEQPLPDLLKLSAGNAVPVRVDVAGAKQLSLSIDFGPNAGVQADVNWAEARLVE